MTRSSSTLLVRAFVAGLALIAADAGQALAQQLPPVRPLGAVVAVSKEGLGAVSAARQLPNGKVLVNDINERKLMLFDADLASFVVLADSTPATGNAYSSRAAGIIPYAGDSTLFVDPQSLSMMLIDPNGKMGRVMSVPRPQEAGQLIGGPNGTPGFDGQGRLVYRAQPVFRPTFANGQVKLPDMPDSAVIVRVDLATRKLDTLATVKISKVKITMGQDENGRMSVSTVINPMQQVDDWALLADGRVAVLRARDYHIDFVSPDGKVTTAPKIPFDWQRLNDSSKAAFIDSVKIVMEKMRTEATARMGANPGGPVTMGGPGGPGGGVPAGGQTMVFSMRMDGEGPSRAGAPAQGGQQQISIPPLNFVSPNEMPDYMPPFQAGAARGDADGNLWVRTSKNVNGGPVYDVINAKGELIDRVQLPAYRFLAGFGTGGWVYMGVNDGKAVRLEKAKVR
jgi:hypothetical protein